MGVGYPGTPGIWSAEQVEGWEQVTSAVHEAGGRRLLQLWHVGRISDPSFLDNAPPVAPSAIAAKGNVSRPRPAPPYPVPRALEASEIPGIVRAFQRGAENAQAAGFDGVEIHGANGYLLDQFLHDGANRRTDGYGGSIENRARLMMEVVDATTAVWGADRVGMHLAPRSDSHDMSDSDPAALFLHVARKLGRRRSPSSARGASGAGPAGPDLKKAFGGVYIVNENFDQKTAEDVLAKGEADAVPSASPSSPIPTCRGASPRAPSSMNGCRRPSTPRGRRAISTTNSCRPTRSGPSSLRLEPSYPGAEFAFWDRSAFPSSLHLLNCPQPAPGLGIAERKDDEESLPLASGDRRGRTPCPERQGHFRARQVHAPGAEWPRLLRLQGYEDWQVVSVAQADERVKVIVANPPMIEAYRAGIPGNGKPFPDGSKIAKIQWTPKKSTEAPVRGRAGHADDVASSRGTASDFPTAGDGDTPCSTIPLRPTPSRRWERDQLRLRLPYDREGEYLHFTPIRSDKKSRGGACAITAGPEHA